jgi:hypothetical protein
VECSLVRPPNEKLTTNLWLMSQVIDLLPGCFKLKLLNREIISYQTICKKKLSSLKHLNELTGKMTFQKYSSNLIDIKNLAAFF